MASAFVDTNILIETDFSFDAYDKVYIAGITLQEIDKHKTSRDKELSRKAKQAIKLMKKNINKLEVRWEPMAAVPFKEITADNTILATAKDVHAFDGDCEFFTNDYCMILKGRDIGIDFQEREICKKNEIDYNGYRIIKMSDEELANFYEHPSNKWGLLENEYVAFENSNGEIVHKQKFTRKGFRNLSFKMIDNRQVGKVKPRNLQQEFYMDLLQNKECRLLACIGGYGVGKDYLALANFLKMVDDGKFSKMVWIRNNIEVEGSKPIGHLPGTLIEKLSVYADIVSDFCGGSIGFENLIREGKLELIHTGFVRGRSFANSIIYCTEAQTLTKEMVQLLISRVGEGSVIFFNGDIKQTDGEVFQKNNGLKALIDTYKGHKNFACIKLSKCERDEIAEMASLMD